MGLDIGSLLGGEVRIEALYGVRPRIYFVRDVSGRLNVEELFSARYVRENSPEGLEEDSLGQTFGPLLWRDRVDFEQGEIFLRDESLDESEVLWVQDLDLSVRNRLESDTLAVGLSGDVKRPLTFGSFSLEGEVKGWKEARRVSELSASVTVQVQDVDLRGLQDPLAGFMQGSRIRGKLKGTLFYEGCLLLPGQGWMELDVQRPLFQSTDVHPRPFEPEHLFLKAGFDADRDHMAFTESMLDLGGLEIEWGGRLGFDQGKVSFLDLSLEGRGLSLAEAVQYIPLGLLDSDVWHFLVNMSKGGEIDVRTRLKGTPEDFSLMETPQGEDALYLWIRFKDTKVLLPVEESYLPFHTLNGVLELTSGTLYFRDFKGWYGRSPMSDIQGSIRNIHHSFSFLHVGARAVLDVPEIFRELDHGIFPETIRLISRGMSHVSGEGSLGIRFDYEFGSEAEEILRITGDVDLADVQARYDDLNLNLREAAGRVSFTESSVSDIQLNMMAGESPVRIEGGVRFASQGQDTDGEIRLLSEPFLAKDLVTMLGGKDEISGALSCRARIGWREGSMNWLATLRGERFRVKTDSHLFSGEDLRAKWLGENGSIRLQDLACRLQGNALFATGEWTSFNPLVGTLEVRSPTLNLARLFQHKRDLPTWEKILKREKGRWVSPEWTQGCRLRLKVGCEKLLRETVSLEDVYLEGSVEEGQVFVKHARARAGGGGITLKGQGDLRDEQIPFTLLYSLSQVPAEDIFRWLSMTPGVLKGPLFLEGNLKGALRPSGSWTEKLDGRASLNSGPCTIARYDLLGKILTMVNFTQWAKVRLSDLNTRGIPCRQIKGSFQIHEDSISTEDLVVDSNIALADLKGEYDLGKDRLDVDLSLRPMEQLDQMLDRIPVVGEVIHGPDGTVVEFNYKIAGPLGDPEVKLVPMRGLNNRISDPLKRLNDMLQSVGERLRPQ